MRDEWTYARPCPHCGTVLTVKAFEELVQHALTHDVCTLYRELERTRMQVEREMLRGVGEDEVLTALFEAYDATFPLPKPPLGYRLWLRVRKEHVNE